MGRAPTSGNCHTCRERRVKCDKTRPSCERCLKAGYTCKGYETVLRIQSHAVVAGDAPGTSRLAKIQTVSSFPVSQTDDAGRAKKERIRRGKAVVPEKTTALVSTSDGSRSESPFSSSGESGTKSSSGSGNSVTLPPELSLSAFVDEISFSYFFHSYGWINMHSILLQDSKMRGSFSQSGLIYDSMRALSYGLMGRDLKISHLQDTSQRLYGSTLKILRDKLSSGSKTELAGMVKPIALLGSYAITVEKDWRFTHHRGLARILEHCGPELFQSEDLLPIFESCRLTLISSSIVRRQTTFLANPEWKSVPWANNPAAKNATSRLLDVMADIPGIIEGVWGLMFTRIGWVLNGCTGHNSETPETVPRLQQRVRDVEFDLVSWRTLWELENPDTAPRILSWSFKLVQDDKYRPGRNNLSGPDTYTSGMMADIFPWDQEDDLADQEPRSDPITFAHMQDVALYTTVLVWTTRLTKYLGSAAKSPTATDFFTTPFHTACQCCDQLPPQQCETSPPDGQYGPAVDQGMVWNVTSARLASAPVADFSARSDVTKSPSVLTLPLVSSAPGALRPETPTMLLPGDVRFASQLRILSWLVDRLPSSRPHVLGTLAAIGLGHCGHDTRPTEGIHEVSERVAGVLESTGMDGADSILLKSYRPVVVNPVA